MKFSIITICRNAGSTIQRTIESVLRQEYKDFEYIIIDGASDDGTPDIAHSYSCPLMKIISEPDRGISDAFNKGIKLSTGDVLFFLNCGDYFVDGSVLGRAADDMEAHRADIYTYAVANLANPQYPENREAGKKCWEKSLIPHQGTFVRREVFGEVGLFNEHFKIRMDYDFFCRCRKAGKKFWCNPIVITYYDMNGISSTDRYRFEKEGLAVRMLYDDRVEDDEREVLDFLIGDKGDGGETYQRKIESQKRLIEKDHKIMVAMYCWLQLTSEGRDPIDFFKSCGYRNVAIYGYGMLGKILRAALVRHGMYVSYIIDQNKDMGEIDIVSWDACWEPTDCIVVTPFYAYREIRERIKKEKGDFMVVSLEDILMEQKYRGGTG